MSDERCPRCNGVLAMIGRVHRCVPVKSSGGGVESRHAGDGKGVERAEVPRESVVATRGLISRGNCSEAGVASGPPEATKSAWGYSGSPAVIETPPGTEFAVKRGRAKIEDRGKTLTAQEPWKAAGMSRASWYRRQKEKRG